MTNIQPMGNEPIKGNPVPIQELKKMDYGSIFRKFDTNKSGTISDKEIQEQGYFNEMFNAVKDFLNQLFPEEVKNFRDEDGFFVYYEDYETEPTLIAETYEDLPKGSHDNIRDARGYDISGLNLTDEQLLNLTIDKTTILSEEQKEILAPYIEKMKDPGLGVRDLHAQGYTGKGVKMAIIDQPLGRHQEYEGNIVEIHDINAEDMGWRASMHGAAVTSIAVGKEVGIAPDADLVYYSAVNLTTDPDEIKVYKERIEKELKINRRNKNYSKYLKEQLDNIKKYNQCMSNKPHADAINKILDENEKLPKEERVTVISISWGFDRFAPGYDELMQAIQRAKEQGVFVISTSLEEHYGMCTCGANRDPKGDVNDPNSYEAGAFWKDYDGGIIEDNSQLLLVPMDHRTVADYTDPTSFRYEGNDGGMSWSTPWLAGMYVLAKQADPDITPEKFWQLALMSSDECTNNDDKKSVGRILNAKNLMEKVEQYKDVIEIMQGSKVNQDTGYIRNIEFGTLERIQISREQREHILMQQAQELYNTYGKNCNIHIDVNEYGDVAWKVEIKKQDNI